MVVFVTKFITGTNQVRLITDNIVPLQSGSVFYERAKLTGAQYKKKLSYTAFLNVLMYSRGWNSKSVWSSDGSPLFSFPMVFGFLMMF